MSTVLADPNVFQGYPVDLLRGLSGMGPALVGDDALYAAVVAFNASSVEGSNGASYGPALLTADATTVVQSITAHKVPDSVNAPKAVVSAEADASWDSYDLTALLAKVAKHHVTVDGRVKTPGKLIAALEAAGVKP